MNCITMTRLQGGLIVFSTAKTPSLYSLTTDPIIGAWSPLGPAGVHHMADPADYCGFHYKPIPHHRWSALLIFYGFRVTSCIHNFAGCLRKVHKVVITLPLRPHSHGVIVTHIQMHILYTICLYCASLYLIGIYAIVPSWPALYNFIDLDFKTTSR